jgi:ribosomal protein L12E/L44/L45/RPP1/RPP2
MKLNLNKVYAQMEDRSIDGLIRASKSRGAKRAPAANARKAAPSKPKRAYARKG